MENIHFTHEQILGFITLPYERTVAARHTARCLDHAAVEAAENGAEGNEQEYTWAATYLDGEVVECKCP